MPKKNTEMDKKLYYSITEVCSYLKLKVHTLRYWENEFKQLKSKRKPGGTRKYTNQQFLLIQNIKKLLYEDKISIQGVKKILGNKQEKFLSTPDKEKKIASILTRISKIQSKLKKILASNFINKSTTK